MGRYFVKVFIILFSSTFLNAQNNFHELNQCKSFDQELSKVHLNQNKNIYLVLLPPSICQRCEGVFNPLVSLIKKKDTSAVFLLIAIHQKVGATIRYIKNKNFIYDYLVVDTSNNIKKYFSVYDDDFTVPYLVKLDKEGYMIEGISFLGIDMSDSLFINRIILNKKMSANMTKHQYDTNQILYKQNNIRDEYSAPIDSNGNIEKIYILSDTLIIVLDGFNNTFKVFTEKGVFVNQLKPSEFERKLFIGKNIDSNIYNHLISNNIIQTLYLGILPTKNKNLTCIMASLPKADLVINGNEYKLDYYNKAAFVYKNFKNQVVKIDTIVPENYKFALLHKQTFLSQNGTKYIPVQKGWPCLGNDDLKNYSSESNPFNDSFYLNAPIYYSFDSKGNQGHSLGSIDPTQQKLRTGYYFTQPEVFENSRFLYLYTGYSNYIYRYFRTEKNNLIEALDTFYIPINPVVFTQFDFEISGYANVKNLHDSILIRNIDKKSMGNPILYYHGLKEYLQNTVIQIEVVCDTIYLLTKSQKGLFALIRYDLISKKIISNTQIPNYIDGKGKITNARLQFNDSDKKCYCIYQNTKYDNLTVYNLKSFYQ